MPQIFRIGSYTVYFGQMKESRLNLSMFTLLKDVHLRLVQKSGLPALGKLF